MSTSSAFLLPLLFVGVSITDNKPGSLDVLRGFIAECFGVTFVYVDVVDVRWGVDGPASEIGVAVLRMLRRGMRVLLDDLGSVALPV